MAKPLQHKPDHLQITIMAGRLCLPAVYVSYVPHTGTHAPA